MSQKYKNAVDYLKTSPMFNLSLSSKELFHSNFLYWIYIANRDAFRALLEAVGIKRDNWGENWVAKREYLNFDLCVIDKSDSKERLLAVIENKVKSIPTAEQLAKYNEKIEKRFGKVCVPKILLSLTESKIDESNDVKVWQYVNYEQICGTLLSDDFQKSFSGYQKELINDYAKFVQALITLAECWKGDTAENNIFLLDYKERESKDGVENIECIIPNDRTVNNPDKYRIARELRIHDLYGKYRTAILKDKLAKRLEDKGLLGKHLPLIITPQIAYSNSLPILEVVIKVMGEREDTSSILEAEAFFISIQGCQYRHAINAIDKGASTKEKRVQESVDRCQNQECWHWFMNPNKHPNNDGGCFPNFPNVLSKSGQRKNICSFAGRGGVNYIYQYKKISPDATVDNVLSLMVDEVVNIANNLVQKDL